MSGWGRVLKSDDSSNSLRFDADISGDVSVHTFEFGRFLNSKVGLQRERGIDRVICGVVALKSSSAL